LGFTVFTEGHVDQVVAAFTDRGFFAKEFTRNGLITIVSFVKSFIRLD
jgi:hypothetical protein